MDYKKEIEKSLKTLENKGYSRAKIEEELGRSPNWIDQTLARGGNAKALTLLLNLEKSVVAKSNILMEKSAEYAADQYLGKYIALLERDRDLLESKITNMEVSLNSVRDSQLGLMMGLQVGLDEAAEIRAAVQKKDPAVVRAEVNKKLAKGLRTGTRVS